MDGFQTTSPFNPALSPVLGILYAEDFGPDAGGAAPLPAPEPERGEPGLTQADLDAACGHAVRAAEAGWQQSAERRRAEALETMAAGLRAAGEAARDEAEAVADGVARAALGLVAAMLPDLCRQHGDHEVRALVARLVPVLASRATLVVRVHPGLVPLLERDLALLDEADRVDLRPANLPPGDVRLSWEEGALVRDAAAIRTALTDSLAQLGLLDAASPQPAERELSLVQ